MWDATPQAARLQILLIIGFFEFWSESAYVLKQDGTTHYMRGGKPGYFPPIKGKGGPGGHFLFNLWDVLGNVEKRTPEQKAKGLQTELLNGRAAMFGLMGLLSASTVPGSVPFLANIPGFPQYAGNVMVPFSADFTLSSMA